MAQPILSNKLKIKNFVMCLVVEEVQMVFISGLVRRFIDLVLVQGRSRSNATY